MRSSRRTPPIPTFTIALIVLLLAGCAIMPGGNLLSEADFPSQAELSPEFGYHTRFPVPTLMPAPRTPTWTATPSNTPAASLTPSPAPQFTATATPTACPFPLGRTEQGQIISPILNRTFDFRVYLPPCYDPQRSGGYPALYLLHGQSMDDSAWDTLGADETAAKLIAGGEVSPFLIVMPRED
ncbi:MAG TPA: alpha/beta hydrolase-fold protein, partial [Levilinea sp.]|nr:alpha/beta hydrolase-fold protein [Levilinea sp.]